MKKIILMLMIFLINIKSVYAFNDTSKTSIVMEIENGRILYQNRSNDKMLIASTTKLMTFLTALKLGQYRLNDTITVGDEVLKMYGTNMYLNIKEKLTLKDLLYGLMLRSGNDASVVIATYLKDNVDDFVEEMNNQAKLVGMNNTTFKNPHGLDEETKNYSTAYDLAILARYLYLNYPEFLEISGSKYYNFQSNLKSYELINRCKMIFTYKYLTTCKNGYTPLAGKSLVSTAYKNNLHLLIVTLDDYDIYENHERMYEYYFSKYQNYLILDKTKFKIPNTNYYIKNNYFYPILESEKNLINQKIIIDDKDDTYGKISISLNEKLIHEEIIYKEKNIKTKKSFFNKVKNFFKNIFK